MADAIRSLQAADTDNSCDEDEGDSPSQSIMQSVIQAANSDSSESELSDDDSDLSTFANVGRGAGVPLTNEWDTLPSRAGVTWKQINSIASRGRAAAKNVFSERTDPTTYAQRGIRPQSPLSAFRLFIDEPMLRSILKFTVNHGKADNPNFSVEIRELEKFIGLQIARRVLVEKNTPIYQFWSKEWGHPIFGKTMSRDRYKELMRHLRFDNFSTRRER